MPRHLLTTPARRAAAFVAAASLIALTGCTTGDPDASGDAPAARLAGGTSTEPSVTVSTSVDAAAGPVAVDEVLEVSAEGGTLERVVVRSGEGRLPGRIGDGGAVWVASGRLEPGQRYDVRAVAADGAARSTHRDSFRTENLPLSRQTYPSIAPLAGETVGVGMPVIVQFDVPVTDRAAIERHLTVESSSGQQGSWHWLSANEVHWRPKTYWEPGTEVTVNADINSVHAGKGVYGQASRSVSFEVGDAIVSEVDVATHTMRVFVNDELQRTMPISAGKPGFITRSGTKVIMEKVRDKVMDAATLGISESDPEYYRLDVEYAMRVTHSGEFLHAAPWSAGSQGVANVSHGCVGMTTDNAAWLFELSHDRGDVVEVTGSDRPMTVDNGYGDWNVDFAEYAEGSAL